MNGLNGPLAVLTFLSSFAVSGAAVLDIVVRVLVMVAVALLGNTIQGLIKGWVAGRRERWRKRALEAEDELARLKSAEKV